MTPLPTDELSKGEEQAMKDWLENYRSVRQRTVRSETTKDKAGTLPLVSFAAAFWNITQNGCRGNYSSFLPPAVYSNANPNATARVFFSS